MPEPDLIELFARPLGRLGIRYMISGSVAVTLFGNPRLTNDIDLVVFLEPADIPRLGAVFPAADFYSPPPDVVAVEIARESRGHLGDRPKTTSRVGEDARMSRPVARATGVPRPAKPARQGEYAQQVPR